MDVNALRSHRSIVSDRRANEDGQTGGKVFSWRGFVRFARIAMLVCASR